MRRIDPDARLTDEEEAALAAALADQFDFNARDVLAGEGDEDQVGFLVLDGLVARMKETGAGRRQIVSILLPGDICAGGLALVMPMDYALVALSDGRAARLTAAGLEALQARVPRLMLPLARSVAEEAAITREWVANVGARHGAARIAHLLCELRWRLAAVGRAGSGACRLPLGQRDIAAAVGLSTMQANRVLQRFRDARLIAIGRGFIDILEPERIATAAAFDPYYLEVRSAAPRGLAWEGVQFSS
jgi:CRP-like cAMP-binding protein